MGYILVRRFSRPCAMATLNFSLWFILKITLVTGQSTVYVLRGREAVLAPALNNPPDDILWKHNGDKVISFDGAEERVFEPYRGRVTLARDTAKLTISDVRYEDSGEYELDIISGERFSRSQYLLKVLERTQNIVVPIVIASLILLVFCIVAIILRHRIKRVCLNMRKNDDCEEQKAADSSPVQKRDESDQITFESELLIASKIHQEETKSSSQRFILQQCDNENVIEESPGNIKDLLKKFESTETSPGKGHDTGGKATSPPTSVSSRVRKPTPGPGQMDSGGEMDLQHEELHNVSTTEEEGDTDSKHSDEDKYEDAPESPEEQGSSVQTENEHHKDDQHNQNNSTKDDGQPTNEEKTELNTVTNPECTVNNKPPKHPTDAPFSPEPPSSEPQLHDIKTTASEQESSVQTDPEKQPDQHHKVKDDEQKMEASNSTDTDVSPTNEVQTENNEPLKDSKDVPVSTQTTTAADHPVAESAQPPLPAPSVDTVGPGSPDQTKAEGGLDTGPETKAPLSDHPPNNEGRLQSAQMSPVTSESQPQSSEPQVNQNIKTTASEQESSVQTESEKQSDEQHKEKDDDQKMEAVHSSNSTERHPEVSPTNEGGTELKEEENELVKESKDVPVSTTTAAHRPESPVGSVSPEETSPDANTETENEVPQNDSSNKESSVSQPQSSQPDPAESEEKIKSKAETRHSETTAPPEPGKAESSGVEAKGHDESNTETQTQDSPHSSSEDNAQGQMSLTSPQTDQPPSQTTDNDKEKKNTGGAEDDKKEKKEESESE